MPENQTLLSRRALTQSLFTVRVEHDLEIPMPDGATLLADRRYPSNDPQAPLVLMRGPYGRSGPQAILDRFIAARGYQVLHVSLRGTSGSGGAFAPFRSPEGDGPATVEWMRVQPWFPGRFATIGTSYLGFSQWELAREHIPEWRAAVIQDAPSRIHPFLYPGGAFALGSALGWTDVVHRLHSPGGESFLRQLREEADADRRMREACARVPITEADAAAVGEHVDWFQEWLRHPEPGAYWEGTDFSSVEHMPPVVHLSGGWFDFFLPTMLRDHSALVESGREVRLRIGPWSHGQGVMSPKHLRDAFATLDLALRDRGYLPEPEVRVFVGGADRWCRSPAWPPPGGTPETWHLRGGDVLSPTEPALGSHTASPSRFRFDPRDPTPSAGGSVMRGGGSVDNRALAERDDVLTFTGPALPEDLWVVGPVSARIHVRTSAPDADVFVRLCDVEPNGRARNVTDGLVRLDSHTPEAADGTRVAEVELWPTGHVFRARHRLRVLVAGGAHPRFARNTGTGDQLDTEMRAVDFEVVHDADHPSEVTLPTRAPGTPHRP
ncbi:CocE/NonD family hydrolase [Nocardiopsis oceani]